LREKHQKVIPLIVSDIRDRTEFDKTIKYHQPFGVIHLAALKSVAESIKEPELYFEVNFDATRKILESISKFGIQQFIFSSTAAVYGATESPTPVIESTEKFPLSPYGKSKYLAELEVEKFLSGPGRIGTNLRYFNVVGNTSEELQDFSVDNLLPIILRCFDEKKPPTIFGTDYPTFDGTCIRDYVDVRDVARAHLKVSESTRQLPLALNVGTGRGYSVREVIQLLMSMYGIESKRVNESSRREGDPAYLCADINLIRKSIGFESNYSLKDSIESLIESQV
jgi:UDP-glucose 4-epimerase